ncbi:dihydrolipoamide acetyltransferase family protein [Nakamurella leprariae]|uniref:Dihydrolipoamide acetyltransferase component of pyruvate dehydrogenase complex n=1 Tax=Nakamurella leprariae TaxID=2803911 RepID=A0A938YJA8_9ACTN|nr:dihydrolipoamide acetyltransferase family protein [Nakamurella leprariae]MBM9468830.1 2-oxo acid dehydrogenase subunit E2 [Nakamurella leprariae]
MTARPPAPVASSTPGVEVFPLPDVGEGLTEAEVLTWHVAVGDQVTVNQMLVEIETAKAAVELPSPYAGEVAELLVPPGTLVAVGTPIIAIRTGAAADAAAAAPAATGTAADGVGERVVTLVGVSTPEHGARRRLRHGRRGTGPTESTEPATGPAPAAAADPRPAVSAAVPTARAAAPLAAPPVRKLAKDLGVDLSAVAPSRADGIIGRADVQAAAERLTESLNTPVVPLLPESEGTAGARSSAEIVAADLPNEGVYDPVARERYLPIRGVRRATAAAMVRSVFTAPHVTEFVTIDVTELMALRDRLRRRGEYAAVKLTPLAFVARAVCLALRRTPELNASWDSDRQLIVHKDYVNLGIAAATPRGLVVPKIRDADAMNVLQLAQQLGVLTEEARAGRTTPASMAGGTFTITNIGIFGVDTGTPILYPGESGILAVGSIKDAPWVVDGELAVRKVCQLSLSFDHRVVDGQQGSIFLADVASLLGDPASTLAY